MLIAGNWKMFKGPAEAGRSAATLAGARAVGRRRRRLRAVRLAPGRARVAGLTVYAQNVTGSRRAPTRARSPPAMLTELGVHGSLVGHRSGASTSARRTVDGAARQAALKPGLGVIACVGETLEVREAGDMELVLKLQVEAIADAVGARRQPRPGLRAGLGDRHRAHRDAGAGAGGTRVHQGAARRAGPLRRLGEAGQRRGAALAARRRRRARRGRLARDRLLRGDLRGRRPRSDAVTPVPLVALVILDGWGIAPPGPGNAVELADTPVFDRIWRDYPHTTLAGVRRGGRPAARPDGQLRGRAPDDRLGARSFSRTCSASTGRSRTGRSSRTRRSAARSSAPHT